MEQDFLAFCEKFLKLHQDKVPLVVVTLTEIVGHAPQNVGCRMIVGASDRLFGTVGGGKIEKTCIDFAQELLKSTDRILPQSKSWNLPRDIGMTCGGEVTFFFEVYQPSTSWRIALFGAGHVVQEIASILVKMDCELTVIDPRQEWLDKLPNSPKLIKILREDMPSVIPELHEHTFVAIITMGHPTDYPIVKRALETRNFPYLGVIGSKVKRIKMNADLRASGMSEERTKQFFLPLGDPIGRNTPPEMAISIISQMLRIRGEFFNIPSDKL
jgi:xanthine dehydrogenase accessory factor